MKIPRVSQANTGGQQNRFLWAFVQLGLGFLTALKQTRFAGLGFQQAVEVKHRRKPILVAFALSDLQQMPGDHRLGGRDESFGMPVVEHPQGFRR